MSRDGEDKVSGTLLSLARTWTPVILSFPRDAARNTPGRTVITRPVVTGAAMVIEATVFDDDSSVQGDRLAEDSEIQCRSLMILTRSCRVLGAGLLMIRMALPPASMTVCSG